MSHADERIAHEAAITLCCIDAQVHPDALQIVEYALGEFSLFDNTQRNACDFIMQVGPRAEFAEPMLLDNIVSTFLGNGLNGPVVQALAAIGPVEEAVPIILDRIEQNSVFRPYYEDYLADFGPSIVPLLIEALDDASQSPAHHLCCLRILGQLGTDATTAVPTVIRFLESDHPRVRETAAETLGSIAASPESSLPALITLLDDPHPLVRSAAARALAAFGPAAEPDIPQLIESLSDDYLEVQSAAIETLAAMGDKAAVAVPALEQLAAGEHPLLRDLATTALSRIHVP
jgi:HEAT repeat protein